MGNIEKLLRGKIVESKKENRHGETGKGKVHNAFK
jgi:hypothetical protein